MAGDILAVEGHDKSGEPLLAPVMQNGHRLRAPEPLAEIKLRAKRELERLPEPLRRLDPEATYPVEVAPELRDLAAEVDRRLQHSGSRP
jgi:nicotinate phosphoribosyltransferase